MSLARREEGGEGGKWDGFPPKFFLERGGHFFASQIALKLGFVFVFSPFSFDNATFYHRKKILFDFTSGSDA